MNNSSKFNLNKTLNAILLIVIALIVVEFVSAAAPNPGHNFTESSGGAAQGDLLYGSAADTFLRSPRTLPRLVIFPTPAQATIQHGRRLILRTALLAIFR